jgi:hypothetical protein
MIIYTNNMSVENPEEMNNNIWDRMFVISGAQEIIRMPVKAENEQISVRPSLSSSDKYAFELGGKLQYENICTGDKEKMKKHNLDICTYGNTLTYFGPAVYNMTFEKFWLGNATDNEEEKKYEGFIGFINEQLKKISSSGPVNFYLGTHHNRLKQTIFSEILDTENKMHFANACCIKMSKINGSWQIAFVFEGFPDKADSNYFTNTGNPLTKKTEGITDPQPLLDYLSGIKGENVNIYIMRHGNAFHNKPLRLIGNKGRNRPLDSCLTPLGIIQADILGKDLKNEGHLNPDGVNIWCTSYMNRAMLTVLQVMKHSGGSYQRLEKFREFYIKYSMAELYKRLVEEKNGPGWDEAISELIKSTASKKIGTPQQVQKALDAYMNPDGIYHPQKYFKKASDFKIADIVKIKFPPRFTFKSNATGIQGTGMFGIGGKKKRTRKKNKLMCPKNCCGLPVLKCGCPESCKHCNCQEIKRLRRLLKRKTRKNKRKKKNKKTKKKKSTKKKARKKRRKKTTKKY